MISLHLYWRLVTAELSVLAVLTRLLLPSAADNSITSTGIFPLETVKANRTKPCQPAIITSMSVVEVLESIPMWLCGGGGGGGGYIVHQ